MRFHIAHSHTHHQRPGRRPVWWTTVCNWQYHIKENWYAFRLGWPPWAPGLLFLTPQDRQRSITRGVEDINWGLNPPPTPGNSHTRPLIRTSILGVTSTFRQNGQLCRKRYGLEIVNHILVQSYANKLGTADYESQKEYQYIYNLVSTEIVSACMSLTG